MIKIAHLSSVHRAQDTRILHRECRSLAEAGYDVVLIANADRGFVEHDVRVRALPAYRGGRLVRVTRQAFRVWRMAREEDADLYQFHDPELIPVGIALRMAGKPVVYDVHESVSLQIRQKYWIPKLLRPLAANIYRAIEKLAGRVFSAIVIAEPTIAQFFPSHRTVLVQNFPIIEELAPGPVLPIAERPKNITFVGNISEVRSIFEMLEAVSLLPEEIMDRFILGGRFVTDDLEEKARVTEGAHRADFMGQLSRQEVRDLLVSSVVGLALLKPTGNNLEAQPVKLFEYMAAGVPVVASDFPYWRQFVSDIGSGIMVDPGDPQAIADAVETILNDIELAQRMSDAGAKAVRERWNWDGEAATLIEMVRSLVK